MSTFFKELFSILCWEREREYFLHMLVCATKKQIYYTRTHFHLFELICSVSFFLWKGWYRKVKPFLKESDCLAGNSYLNKAFHKINWSFSFTNTHVFHFILEITVNFIFLNHLLAKFLNWVFPMPLFDLDSAMCYL